jgi:3-hydroxyisobutyrate dehydrogenase-like beta-hydroxyacid dehydrogenase
VPPGVAWSFADRTAQLLRTRERRLLFAECNAVSPAVVTGIGERMSAAGAVFADAGIIGQPPGLDGSSPRIYASGPAAEQLAVLREYGLDVRVLAKPLGAASALKMCYAGITKGVSAVGSAMLMASEHAGVADALARELADSQAGLRAHLGRTLPSIFGRAYRWVAEMQYIAEFAGEHDPAAAEIFRGAAALYERIARTGAAASDDAALIARFLRRGG